MCHLIFHGMMWCIDDAAFVLFAALGGNILCLHSSLFSYYGHATNVYNLFFLLEM